MKGAEGHHQGTISPYFFLISISTQTSQRTPLPLSLSFIYKWLELGDNETRGLPAQLLACRRNQLISSWQQEPKIQKGRNEE